MPRIAAVTCIALISSATAEPLVPRGLPSAPQPEHAGFVRNIGQMAHTVLYATNIGGASFRFLDGGVSAVVTRARVQSADDEPSSREALVWNISFEGRLPSSRVEAERVHAGTSGWLHRDGRSHRRVGIPEAERLWYRGLYRNIDLRYSAKDGALKYDYFVRPGGAIGDIRMKCDGIESLRINQRGELEIETPWGIVTEAAPIAWQHIDGRRRAVRVRFALLGETTFGFVVDGSYSRRHTLVIDPLVCVWSTFVGGYETDGYILDMAVDPVGDIYAVGFNRNDFPTTPGAYATSALGLRLNAVIFKLSADGSRMLAATFVSSTAEDWATSLAIAADGSVWVAGKTFGADFPQTDRTKIFNAASPQGGHSFLLRLDATLARLEYSRLVAPLVNGAPEIELAANGDIVLATGVAHGVIPPDDVLSFARTPNGENDVLVCRITSTGDRLVYAGYLGTNADDSFGAFALGPDDAPCVALKVRDSPGFITTPGAFRETLASPFHFAVALVRIAPDGRSIVYATYIAPRADIRALDVSDGGEVLVAGQIDSANAADFPITPGAYDTVLEEKRGGFITRFSADGSSLVYSTFLGSRREAYVSSILMHGDEALFTLMVYEAPFFEQRCGVVDTLLGEPEGWDVYVGRLSADGARLISSQGFRGSENDYEGVLARAEGSDEVIVGLTTHSNNFPTTLGSFQPVRLNPDVYSDQIVVMKLGLSGPAAAFDIEPLSCHTFRFIDRSCSYPADAAETGPWRWDFGDGATSNERHPLHAYARPGTYMVTFSAGSPASIMRRSVGVGGTPVAATTRARIERTLVAEIGSDLIVPIHLDDDASMLGATDLTIAFRYDTTMLRHHSIDSARLGRMKRQTVLETWDMTVGQWQNGYVVLRATAPAGEVLKGPGLLLRLELETFLRAGTQVGADSWSSELLLDVNAMTPTGAGCYGLSTESGRATLDICGLQQRLIDLAPPLARIVNVRPNPASRTADIELALPFDDHVRIEMLDLNGRLMTTISDELIRAGSRHFTWDARAHAPGMYVCRVRAGALRTSALVVVAE